MGYKFRGFQIFCCDSGNLFCTNIIFAHVTYKPLYVIMGVTVNDDLEKNKVNCSMNTTSTYCKTFTLLAKPDHYVLNNHSHGM